jgi:predicted amidophosphoribosyltransferase
MDCSFFVPVTDPHMNNTELCSFCSEHLPLTGNVVENLCEVCHLGIVNRFESRFFSGGWNPVPRTFHQHGLLADTIPEADVYGET